MKNGITRRHNALRDEWSKMLVTACVPHAKEVCAVAQKRPADILLLAWDKGQDMCVDFTICNPLTADAFPLNLDAAKRHLAHAEKEKIRKEGPLCAAARWGFHPAAFSPWGGMGPSARWLLAETTKKIASDLPHAAHAVRVAEIRQNLSLTIAREVARQLSLRCQVIQELC
jgi:hypothetical protein